MFQSSTKPSTCAHDPICSLLFIQDNMWIIVSSVTCTSCMIFLFYTRFIAIDIKHAIIFPIFKKATPHHICPPAITLFIFSFITKSVRKNCLNVSVIPVLLLWLRSCIFSFVLTFYFIISAQAKGTSNIHSVKCSLFVFIFLNLTWLVRFSSLKHCLNLISLPTSLVVPS